MAFKPVMNFDAENTIALGGINRQTNKKNPIQVEGYFLGSKTVESKKSKDGFCKLHILQTSTGNLGVWGKTDLDRKITGVAPGTMVRLSYVGMLKIPGKNDMYQYKVEQDEENTIDVSSLSTDSLSASSEADGTADYDAEETSVDDEASHVDEPELSRPVTPKKAVNLPSASKVKGLLGNRTTRIA